MGVAIAASIPLGINRSLVQKREDISYTFYSDQAGYSISDGIEKRQETANDLITLANRYKDKDPELEGLIDSLDYCVKASENAWSDDDTYTQEAGANAALDAPAEALAAALEKLELSEQDKKYPGQMLGKMRSEQDKINRSSYNEEARAFNKKLESLSPMALCKPMADFSAPADNGATTQAVPEDTISVEEAAPGAAAKTGDTARIPSPPEAPAAPDLDELGQRVDQWANDFADGVESGVEGFVDGIFG